MYFFNGWFRSICNLVVIFNIREIYLTFRSLIEFKKKSPLLAVLYLHLISRSVLPSVNKTPRYLNSSSWGGRSHPRPGEGMALYSTLLRLRTKAIDGEYLGFSKPVSSSLLMLYMDHIPPCLCFSSALKASEQFKIVVTSSTEVEKSARSIGPSSKKCIYLFSKSGVKVTNKWSVKYMLM